jgi:hypothetical protein
MQFHIRAAVLGYAILLTGTAIAGDCPCTMETLTRMSWCELEELYRRSPMGCPPSGYYEGKAIYCGKRAKAAATNATWRGKHFECGGSLINQWCGFKAVRANVYVGESWVDGKPALIMDYRGTSKVWSDVRDELREVCPGVYLGIMYRDRCTGPERETFFVLQRPCR